MRLLFAYPFFLAHSALERQWLTPYPPLGLLYLAAAARQAGHAAALFDGTFAAGEADFAAALDHHRPEAVCLASLITLRDTAARLARLARARGALTVAGGPDPTSAPEAYAADFNVMVLGEGERTLNEWLEARAPVPGLAFAGPDGALVRTPARAPIMDLDSLPHPARDLVDMPRYFDVWRQAHSYTSIALSASRGCPFGCEYCASAAAGPHWRVRSPESVAREMRALEQEYRPDRFRLVDDLDGLGRDWLLQLAEAMTALGVKTPYEGLRLHVKLGDLPMLARFREVCADRNAWIPKTAQHPHAPPALAAAELQQRWAEAQLPEGAELGRA